MTVNAWNLRPITDQDSDLLYRIFKSTRAEEFAQLDWGETEKEAFLQLQFQAQHTYYRQNYTGASFDLLLIDDVPVGRLYVLRGAREIRIIDIALLPEYRGQGIGTRVLQELLEEADRAAKSVTIHVEVFNPARSLYDRLGFRLVEDKEVYLFMERPAALR